MMAVVVVILVALVVLAPIVAGFLNDPAPAPTGRVDAPEVPTDDSTVAPGIQKALKEMARREAAQASIQPLEILSVRDVTGARPYTPSRQRWVAAASG